MPTDSLPPEDRKRVTLTSREAAEGFGRALCEIANNLLADGKLDAAEATALGLWLDACGDVDLPALNYIRDEMRRYTVDGTLLPWELGRLQLALERILPAPDRAIAKAARKRIEAELEVREAAESEESRESKRRSWEELRAPRTDEGATIAQMKFIEDLGGNISNSASMHEASELIGRLLAERDGADSDSVPLSPMRTAPDGKLRQAVAAYHPRPGQTTFEVSLPVRQPYEGRATLKQKDLIWSLGFKDQAVIDSLGKWQASALIDQLKAREQSGCGTILVVGIMIVVVVAIAILVSNWT